MSLSFIETFTGLAVKPLAISPNDIRIADVAHALSQQCRFSGHTKEFYSVAEHCVRVSWLLEDWAPGKPAVQLWGLLHDASEAYLVDIPKPLKEVASFLAYRNAEASVMEAICERFDLPKKEPAIVKRADMALLATEARDLMPFRPEHWGALDEQPLENPITPWTPREAEKKFLAQFALLYRS